MSDKGEIIAYCIMAICVLLLVFAFDNVNEELQQMKKQAIEYGYGETSRISGEFQWKEKGK